jgi:proliferating cell nuclear antigen PCNA
MIELKKPDFFRSAVGAISLFISEGNFRFNEKGMSFRAVDASQIVLVNYLIEGKVFDKYNVEPALIGLDLGELNKITSRSLPNDILSMNIKDSEILINLDGELSRNFTLPLIDVSDDEVKLPDYKYETTVTINSKILKEALKDASLFGSSVVLRVKKNQFFIEARSSSGSLNIATKDKGVKVKGSSEVVAKFSLNFLSNITREADNEKDIEIHLRNDAPMKVTYPVGKSQIEFYLAHMLL